MQTLDLAGAAVASDMGIFKLFAKQNGPLRISDISSQIEGDELLISRIVRFLVAHGMLDQADSDSYVANEITTDYANDARASMLKTMLLCSNSYLALPDFLSGIGYRNPADVHETAWQPAFNTTETFWEWYKARPDSWWHFSNMMTLPRSKYDESLAKIYPFEKLFEGSTADDVLMVDVFVSYRKFKAIRIG